MGTSGTGEGGDGLRGQSAEDADLERTQRLTDLLSGDPPDASAGDGADDGPADDGADDTAAEDAGEDTADAAGVEDDDGPDIVPPTERIEFPIDLSTPPPEVVEERRGDRPGPTDRIRYGSGADDDRPGPTDRIQYTPGAHHEEPGDDDDDDDDPQPARPPAGWAPAPEGFAPGSIGEPGAGRPARQPSNVDWGPSPGAPVIGVPVVGQPGAPVAGPGATGGPVIGGPSYQTTVQNQTIEQQNIGQQIVHGGGGGEGPGGGEGDDAPERIEDDDVVSEVPAPVQSRPARPEDIRRSAQKEEPQGPGRLSDRLGQPTRKGRERERVVAETPALRGLPGGPGLRTDGTRRGSTPADRHTPGMMHPSVWQRLNLVWRDAGTDWERVRRDGATEWQQSGDAFLAGRGKRRGPLPDIPRPLMVTLGAVAAVLLVIAGVAALSGGGPAANDDRIGGASDADKLFAVPSGAKGDGVDQGIGAIGRFGSRIVISGREKGGAFDRPQFFSSSDGGTTWTPGVVRGAHGGAVPPGGAPTRIVGGPTGWIALNITNVPVWFSTDGSTWTQVPDDQAAAAFREGDSVSALVAKTTGFLAVGTHTSGDKTTPVVWRSDDGKSWTRTDNADLKVPGGSAQKLSGLATRSDVVIAGGTVRKTVTKEVTVKKGKKKKKVKRKTTVTTDGFWRSTDGGVTWQSVDVPQSGGSSGQFVGLAATKDAFYAVRPGSGGHNGVVMASADGQEWKQSGSITGGKKDNLSISMVSGGDDGIAVLGSIGNGHNVVYQSGDGKNFKRIADLGSGSGRTIRGVEPMPGGIVAVGSTSGEDEDPYVATAGDSGRVNTTDLSKVPGAAHPDHMVTDVRYAGGRYVAVGSANGDAAAWTSADGKSWKPATPTKDTFARSGSQRLQSVARGPSGWLAVGRAGKGRPLVAYSTSAGAAQWSAMDGDKVFSGSGVAANAAAYGPEGYAVVGSSGDDAMAWSSKDLKSWTKGEGAGLGAPDDSSQAMTDVAAGSFGYVAVGSVDSDAGSEPTAWISSDGGKWTRVEMDLPDSASSAQLTRVALNGNRLVAAGVALTGEKFVTFTMTSVDGGKSWQPAQPPGEATGEARVSDVTPLGKGFALLASQGAPGAAHVRLWTSSNGTSWKSRPLEGADLVGKGGTQVVNAATVNGGSLLGVGFAADARTEHVTLWQTPLK